MEPTPKKPQTLGFFYTRLACAKICDTLSAEVNYVFFTFHI